MTNLLPILWGQVDPATPAENLTETAVHSTSAVMHSFQHVASQFVLFAPKVLAALVVLIIGYLLARLLARAITTIAERLGLQRAAESGGLVQSMQQVGIDRTVPQIVGTIFFW